MSRKKEQRRQSQGDGTDIDPLFVEKYKKLLGDRYDEFMRISLTPLNKAIRVNTLKITPTNLKKRLEKIWDVKQVPWCKEGFWLTHKTEDRQDLGNLIEHGMGYFYVQDPASMIPPVVLDPKPGDIVLDMCAAPGSKSTQIAQYMKQKGVLISNDNSPDRLKSLEINLRRLGILNAIVLWNQGNHLDKLSKNGIMFDKILLDAPCSGSGTIRKSYKTILNYSTNFVKRCSRLQKQLIDTAFRMLKPGGTLVYSTCTLEPFEDEEVISYILEKEKEATLEEIKLPLKTSPIILEWEGNKYNPEVKKCIRMYPQDNDTEGFFVAKIKKQS